MFDLTVDHIARLDDARLRDLVRRRCEAEFAVKGLPIAAVTAGGNQRAADGGIDALVEVVDERFERNVVPRPFSGLQVKQHAGPFGPARIRNEACPEGPLRPSIRELARARGAYVIVGGGDFPADPALQDRLNAMREAVDGAGLHVDFHGGDRVDRWANRHPGVVLWVRRTLVEPLNGWQPFGAPCDLTLPGGRPRSQPEAVGVVAGDGPIGNGVGRPTSAAGVRADGIVVDPPALRGGPCAGRCRRRGCSVDHRLR